MLKQEFFWRFDPVISLLIITTAFSASFVELLAQQTTTAKKIIVSVMMKESEIARTPKSEKSTTKERKIKEVK